MVFSVRLRAKPAAPSVEKTGLKNAFLPAVFSARLNRFFVSASQTTLSLPDLPGIEPGWELLNLDAPAARGRFTTEQLERHAERRAAILSAIAEGMGLRRIAKAFGVSTNTLLSLARVAGVEIETQKERLGNQFSDLARLAVERMTDEIDDMPKASLPLIAGIATDKAQLLRGAPTVRVQHDHALTIKSVADYIDALPSATPVCSEGIAQQKAAQLSAGATVGEHGIQSETIDLEAVSVTHAGDSQSPVSDQSSEESVRLRPKLNGSIQKGGEA